MEIGRPIVHLEEDGSNYHIHVITWFDHTKFKADGHDTLSTVPDNGVFTITLYVAEDTGVPNMQLLTPVVHTLTLTGIALGTSNPLIDVEVINTEDDSLVGKKKTHVASASSSAMPDPGSGTGNRK